MADKKIEATEQVSAKAMTDAIIDAWFVEYIANSPVSRASVEVLNHVTAAKDALKRILSKEV